MKNIVIGTSGHIDHGKSTLVKALTGTDPDRWAEEKKRGITIDLGFASYVGQDDLQVSFIDVPGHEKFIHNMLAGVSGIDLLLLVVAADEGVMPQTREHLAICHLLGIRQGIVVLTRTDLAEAEMIELAEEEVKELVKPTFLHESPIIKVSAVTGEGLDTLRETIARLAAKHKETVVDKSFRLPIDRSFTVKGFGTVITGTVVSGSYSLPNPLLLYPKNREVRVRGLQVHGKAAEKVQQGERAAFNLAGFAADEIERGDQLCSPGFLVNTRVIDAELEILPDKLPMFKNRMRLLFYSGTKEVSARVIRYSNIVSDSNKSQFVQFRLEEFLSCRYGDRFIVRTFSPLDTIGGGRIIAPFGNRSRKNKVRLEESLAGLAAEKEETRLSETLFLSGTSGMLLEELPPLVDLGGKSIQKHLQRLSSIGEILLLAPDRKKYMHSFHVSRIARFLVQVLAKFHRQFPEKAGASRVEFGGKVSRIVRIEEITTILEWAVKKGQIVKEEEKYRLPDFQGHLTGKQAVLKERLIERLLSDPFQPPGLVNLATEVDAPVKEVEKSLKIGIGENWAVRVKEDIWFHQTAIEQIREKLLLFFDQHAQISVVEFKDLIGISRKNAIGLLEYFDSIHLTRRLEDYRILRLGK